ncbi:cell wall integrity protein scw1 isoform X2 [Andrographis paniculata]|uniref:cell wall integrity protein scw1 isoform X2 n=1 Tax=Andrographis paniculata TaxID=175694 RepID=UPI0021E8B655|nr:cell wall integrity protein scw1 isoform X2 [Andrographis paniculata]
MAHPPPYEPYYLAAAPPEYGYSSSDGNGINTLFVSGLPDDVKAREIHNLFRRRPGFESCQLKYTGRGNQVVAFATFVNHQSALTALHSLNGVKFDPQTGSTLHIELARSNSRRKNKPGSGPYVVIDKRARYESGARGLGSSSDDDSDSDASPNIFDSANQADTTVGRSIQPTTYNDGLAPENAERMDGACSTLFIANLGPKCTEDELKRVLSQYQGFNSLKVRARGGMPVAFADFGRVEHATDAMMALQGSTLPSSDRGGMHIEYARSKMRKP